MIAWLTRLLLLVQAAVAVGIALLLTRKLGFEPGLLPVLLGIAAVIAVRLLIVANNFLLAYRYRSPLPPESILNWKQRLQLYFGEARATLTASSWNMPFRRFHHCPAAQPRGLPVLLIHGYGCNSGYWRPMSGVLREAGITHHALDMEPVFGSIDEYAAHIHEEIEALCRATGSAQVIIVAHSMGGLATRAYLRDFGPARLARVITLGTPHHGTALAQFGVGINTQEMVWMASEQEGLSSEWLRRLAGSESGDTYRLFVSIYTHHDNIVSPQTSSHLPGAKNIALHGIGHVALVPAPEVQELVVREVLETGRSRDSCPA